MLIPYSCPGAAACQRRGTPPALWAADQVAACDAHMACLALGHRCVAAVAKGDLSRRQDNAECRRLVDFRAAAPLSASSASPTPAALSPLAYLSESASR